MQEAVIFRVTAGGVRPGTSVGSATRPSLRVQETAVSPPPPGFSWLSGFWVAKPTATILSPSNTASRIWLFAMPPSNWPTGWNSTSAAITGVTHRMQQAAARPRGMRFDVFMTDGPFMYGLDYECREVRLGLP